MLGAAVQRVDGRRLHCRWQHPTAETRRQLAQQAQTQAERFRAAVRSLRNSAVDEVRAAALPQDDGRDFTDRIQRLHDRHQREIDAAVQRRRAELLGPINGTG